MPPGLGTRCTVVGFSLGLYSMHSAMLQRLVMYSVANFMRSKSMGPTAIT